MKSVLTSKGLALSLLTLALSGCGGSDGGDTTKNEGTNPVIINKAPVIQVAESLQVQERGAFSFTAQASDSDGEIKSYLWQQTAGLNVELLGQDTDTISFNAPNISENNTVTLTLTVTDDKGEAASQEFVITLNAYPALSTEAITDSALLSCIEQAQLDLGSTQIVCQNAPVQDLAGLEQFTELKSLTIENSQLTNIGYLNSLTQLESLTLHGHEISDFSVINQLDELTELALTLNSSTDFDTLDLASFAKLLSLDLRASQDSSYLTVDLSILPTTLSRLSLHRVKNISETDLYRFTQLEALSLTNVDDINTLSFLTKMPNIKEFEMDNDGISDPSAFITTPNLTKLALINSSIDDYSFLSELQYITELNITGRAYYHHNKLDINTISHLADLTSLKLNRVQLENADAIRHYTKLNTLELSNNSLETISFLKDLTELTSFSMMDNSYVQDIAWLEFTPKLESLTISRISDRTSFVGLDKLENLKRLNLEISNYTSNFDVQTYIQSSDLEAIHLHMGQISNLDQLSDLPKLNTLYIKEKNLKTLPNLTSLTALESLTLVNAESYNDEEQIEDLSSLGNTQSLKHLELTGFFKVSDLMPVGQISSLEQLKLSRFATSDIQPLTSLNKLKSLTVQNFNNLVYVSGLSGLTNLEHLDLQDNDYLFCDDIDSLKSTFTDIDSSNFPYYNCLKQPVDMQIIADENLKAYLKSYGKRDIANTEFLDINATQVSSITGVEQFKELKTIKFSSLKSKSLIDNTVLDQLPKLEQLTLEYGQIISLKELTLPKTVTKFYVDDQYQTLDLEGFNASQLTHLTFRWSHLANISEIANYTNLTYLDLQNSSIEDLTPFFTLKNLQELRLQYNSSIDCSQLENLKATLSGTTIHSPYHCN